MHPDLSILADLGLVFAVAVGLALLLVRLRLPAVLAYLATGLLLGPHGLGVVTEGPLFELLAEIGVVLLLFTLGLELSLEELRRNWRAVLLAGTGQVALTSIAGMGAARFFGISWPEAVVWGFLLALSSTAVVLRLLDDRGELHAPHGRLILGILLFQDLAVVPMMLMLPLLAGRTGGAPSNAGALLGVALEALLLIAGVLVASRFVVPRVMHQVARSRNREVFLLAVLAVGGLTAWATAQIGLSLALGAFLAGVLLAETEYAHQALSDVIPLRAVMLCVFFVGIGMLLDVGAILADPGTVAGLVAAVLLGKLLITSLTAMALRFPVSVAVVAGASLAQVGEFSFVLSRAAVGLGLLSPEQERLFLAASVVTIAIAPAAVSLSPRFLAGSPLLAPLERLLDGRDMPEQQSHDELEDHVIVAGFGVGGRTLVAALERVEIPSVLVELNPETVRAERTAGRRVVYGDATSEEVLRHAGLRRARALVLVLSDSAASQHAALLARRMCPELPVFLRTRFLTEEEEVRKSSVDVISEEFAGALAVTGLVLRRLGVTTWSRIVADLVGRHEAAPVDEDRPV